MRPNFHLFQLSALWALFWFAKISRAPPPDGTQGRGQAVNVMVGQKGLKFVPPTVNAVLNEKVTFWFFPKNHTLTQTSLEEPCNPLQGKSSFDSGPISVSMNSAEFPTQILTVNTLKPIYFACLQKMHCELGMVGGVNLPASGPGSLEDFTIRAKATKGKSK
ncbi:hypothetical protein PCASD_18111 [Puccinia coronata f. sp. avenae]|uniref:Blue (type 1) copper domain-containing protein n=1 Tax=Puccinia coronata f. sp. avenae TaxID=200324 RepID=A0A2N5SSN0_9BASI|nr:hypothetical protein PCASD_18111 [Puccinia coronata f. sp. avenae]